MLELKHVSTNNGLTGGLHDISLSVEPGEIMVITGPNGSGKSLLCQVIANPDIRFEGDIIINHFSSRHDLEKAKHQVGYTPQDVQTEEYLTGFEYLELIGSFYHLSAKVRQAKILELAREFHCLDELYTLGERQQNSTRQKIHLIASLLATPPLLVWDEPTQHLDEFGRSAVLRQLEQATKAGSSALIATNDLDLAATIADRVTIISHGQLVTEGTVTQLEHLAGTHKKDLSAAFEHLLAHD